MIAVASIFEIGIRLNIRHRPLARLTAVNLSRQVNNFRLHQLLLLFGALLLTHYWCGLELSVIKLRMVSMMMMVVVVVAVVEMRMWIMLMMELILFMMIQVRTMLYSLR